MNAHVDDAAAAPVGVRGHDGAVDVEIELAVRRRTEWRRHAVALGPRVQRDGCDREGDEERGKQAEASDRRDRPGAWVERRRIHGQPPPGAEPDRPLPGRRRPVQDEVQVVGRRRRAFLREPGVDESREAIARGHANRPSAISVETLASASSEARMADKARWRRDFAVPRGIRIVSATSGSDRSR